ncbi:hypothetical protein LXL04_019994 [Taraxacum kok-saghyz]
MPGRPKVNRRKCPTEKEGKQSVSKKGMSIPRCENAHVDEEPVADGDEEPVVVGEEEPVAVADDANDHVYEEQIYEQQVFEEQVYDEHMVTTNGNGGFVANKRRLPSERITKLKLKKRVVTKDGSGESH